MHRTETSARDHGKEMAEHARFSARLGCQWYGFWQPAGPTTPRRGPD